MRALLAVVYRELQEAARRKRTFWLRVGYGGALAAPIAFMVRISGPQTQGLGAALFQTFVYWQFALIILLAPASAASSVSEERNSGTLGLLLLTGLRPWSIIVGKLAAESLRALTLVLSGLPILFVTTMFGGVAPTQIASAFIVTIGTVVLLAALGTAISSFETRAYAAIVKTYAIVLVFGVGVQAVLSVMGLLWPAAKWVTEPISILNPGIALSRSLAGQGDLVTALQFLLLATLLTVLFVLVGAFGLNRVIVAETAKPSLLRKRTGAPQTRIRGEINGHPIAWRDGKGNPWVDRFLAFLLVCVLIVITYTAGQQRLQRELPGMWAASSSLFWFFLSVVVMVRGASLFAAEKEDGALPSLLMTPFSDAEIVDGKLRALMREFGTALWGMLLLTLLVGFVLNFKASWVFPVGGRYLGSPFLFALTGLVCPVANLAFVATFSLWHSLVASTPGRAVVYNIVSQMVVYMGLGIAGMIVVAIFRRVGPSWSLAAMHCFRVSCQLIAAFMLYDWMSRNLRSHLTRS